MLRTLGFLSLLYCMIVVASSQSCTPSCKDGDVNVPEGTKVPNPLDCAQYYVCSDVDPSDEEMDLSNEPVTCETGKYFDVAEYGCKTTPAEGAACPQLCNPCVIECTVPGQLIPDMEDCSKYEICIDGTQAVELYCNDGWFFDYKNGLCVEVDASVCYDLCDPCVVHCIKEGIIPDPNNCHGYLFCEPPTNVSFDCPEGMMYGNETTHCIKGTECTPACPTETTPTASTTETTTVITQL